MQKEILTNLVDDPKVFKTIKLNPASYWQGILQRLGLKRPEYVDIQIQGSTFRTVQKISLIILEMRSKSDYKGEDKIFDLMQANVYDMARIIATAVHNKPTTTPNLLIDSVMDNISNTESKEIVEEIYGRLDIQSFFGSMGYLKNLTILTDTQETTASQPLSEVSNLPTS